MPGPSLWRWHSSLVTHLKRARVSGPRKGQGPRQVALAIRALGAPSPPSDIRLLPQRQRRGETPYLLLSRVLVGSVQSTRRQYPTSAAALAVGLGDARAGCSWAFSMQDITDAEERALPLLHSAVPGSVP